MADTAKQEVFMDYGRQLDIFDPATFKDTITIIGTGGIGSPAAIVLSKMGCSRIVTYDPDVIEIHNLPNQFFRTGDVDKKKVDALHEIVSEFSGVSTEAKAEFYIDQAFESGIVISAVDNMETRKAIWKKVKYNPRIKLFIDARMGGEVARIYAINPLDIDEIQLYEKTLYSDSDAQAERCTAKAIIYNVFAIASVIGSLVKKYAKGEKKPKEILIDLVNLSVITS